MGNGQIDYQAAAQGDTSGSVTGSFSLQYTCKGFHQLPQPLFRHLGILDPALQVQFATDHTWQAQFGWTLLQHQWEVFGQQLDLSLQQSVARQFGESSSQSAWIANLLQGQAQVTPKSSSINFFAQVGFYGRRNDDGTWQAGFQGTIGVGVELEVLFKH